MTANDVLKIAEAEIGSKESPENSNNVKYNTWYYNEEVSGSAYSWCMVFVQWVFDQAGMELPRTASCTYLMNYAKNNGRWVTNNFKPGDILLYDFDGITSDADHTGICKTYNGIKATAIEGNTSIEGHQSNGGEVCLQSRNKSLILGAYRPEYDGDADIPIVRYDLDVDGEIGKNTVKALQDFLGTPVDGWIDGQYLQYKAYWTSIISESCNWSNGTSQVVKALQELVNVKADGILGQNTARALQKYLIGKGFSCGSTGVDGYFGTDSAKALQRFLNSL